MQRLEQLKIALLLHASSQVYFIADENLVVLTVVEPKNQVDSNLNQLERQVLVSIYPCENNMRNSSCRDLEILSSESVRVHLYDTREYTYSMPVTSPSRKRQDTLVTITRLVVD